MKILKSFLNQFGPLSAPTLTSLVAVFEFDELKKGDYFIREGEYASEIAFLGSGIVRAFYINSQGKEYNKSFFVAPSMIGSYAALISKEKNRLPQQALSDCTIWLAKFKTLEQLSKNNHEIERLRRNMAEQFFVWNEKKQLDMALLDAKERYLIFKTEYSGIESVIPQYHIASYLGISPTQLSRIRQQ
jgi:CRP-like cAMP-binding protein